MKRKKVLICCANGVATSTFVATKLKNRFTQEGIKPEIKTCTNLEVRALSSSFKPDLIVSNVGKNIKIDLDIPIVNGASLLSGKGADEVWEEIMAIMNKC